MTMVGTPVLGNGNEACICGGNDGAGTGLSKLISTGPFDVSRSIGNGVFDHLGQMRSPTRCAIDSLSAMFAASAAGGVVAMGAAAARSGKRMAAYMSALSLRPTAAACRL